MCKGQRIAGEGSVIDSNDQENECVEKRTECEDQRIAGEGSVIDSNGQENECVEKGTECKDQRIAGEVRENECGDRKIK